MRTVEEAQLPTALAEALQGGPAVAPIPADEPSRQHTLDMLRPGAHLEAPGIAAVIATSGSTGAPKGVMLSRAAITASVAATHARLGGPGGWILALPVTSVGGLMVVARSIVAGTPLIAVPSDLDTLAAALPNGTGSVPARCYLSLVAAQLGRALDNRQISEALAQLTAVLVGGGPLPRELADRARQRGVRVVSTYGMSETCGGVVYDGVPLDGVQVDLEPGTGRVRLAGPMMFSGYRGQAELTNQTLTDQGLVTRDRGAWVGSRLVIQGRLDDVVISGGFNIDLAAVERVCQDWAGKGSGELAILDLPHPVWGSEVVAVTDGTARTETPEADLAELRAFVQERLPSYAAPRRLIAVSSLPHTPSGNVDRATLRHQVCGGKSCE